MTSPSLALPLHRLSMWVQRSTEWLLSSALNSAGRQTSQQRKTPTAYGDTECRAAMRQVLEDDALHRRLAAAGHRHVQRFSRQRAATEWMGLYGELGG